MQQIFEKVFLITGLVLLSLRLIIKFFFGNTEKDISNIKVMYYKLLCY